MEKKFCGARNRQGLPCRKPAGAGTDHLGEGRCKFHGGASTGPKNKRNHFNNKNNLKTGEFEQIMYELLEEDEKTFWDHQPEDRIEILKYELRLQSVRIYKMMKRIRQLELDDNDLVVSGRDAGVGPNGPIDVTSSEHRDSRILRIEDAITKLQNQRTRTINEMTKIMDAKKDEGDLGALDSLLEAIEKSNQMIEKAKDPDSPEEPEEDA